MVMRVIWIMNTAMSHGNSNVIAFQQYAMEMGSGYLTIVSLKVTMFGQNTHASLFRMSVNMRYY